ncbi:MAG: hypothetical protein LBS22_03690 [Puniceicoccales bacterium]|jgi:hypothetical protein|nr:hypothetical protein [Puniceicoccales bacterium]
MEEVLTPLISENSPKTQSSPGVGVYIPRNNVPGVISNEEKYKDADLNERHIVPFQGYIPDIAQREKICKLMQQVIAKICGFTDGVSLVLDAWGFKTTKDILDALSNITRFVLPKSDRSLRAYFYDGAKKEIVFKRLIVVLSSTCKVILKLAPQLTRLQALSKLFPHVSLILGILELGLNYEQFTKDGLTAKNVSKIAAALCYHAVSCATFAVAGGSGAILALGLAIRLTMYFSWLLDEGMKDTSLIMQPIDRLWFKNKISENICSLFSSIRLATFDPGGFQCKSDDVRTIYLTLIGLKLCYSTASAIVTLIRDSQKTSEPNPTEAIQQGKVVIEDTNENLSSPYVA